MNPYTRFDYISWGVDSILITIIAFLAPRLKVGILWFVLVDVGMSALIL